jgi:hypothetical protein
MTINSLPVDKLVNATIDLANQKAIKPDFVVPIYADWLNSQFIPSPTPAKFVLIQIAFLLLHELVLFQNRPFSVWSFPKETFPVWSTWIGWPLYDIDQVSRFRVKNVIGFEKENKYKLVELSKQKQKAKFESQSANQK